MDNQIEYNNYNIEITQDSDLESPRDWYCNLGVMVCFHKRYILGDSKEEKLSISEIWNKYGTSKEEREIILHFIKDRPLSEIKYIFNLYNSYADLIEHEELKHPTKQWPEKLFALPLFLYDHSGITIKTTPFSCSWDSGCIGYIYTTKEKLEERGLNDLTESEIYEALKQEVKTYDQYLTGDIYHYSILNSENEVIDSCGGFYGFDDTLTECKAIIDQLNNKEEVQNDLTTNNINL